MAHLDTTAVLSSLSSVRDTASVRLLHPNLSDTLHITVSNLPPGDSPWIKVGLPVGLAVLAVLGGYGAARYGAMIGGREARIGARESQKAYFDEEERRHLFRAIRATKRHLDGTAIASEALSKSPPDLEIAPTLLLQLRSIVKMFKESAQALGVLEDRELEDDIHTYFENIEMTVNSIERGERVFKEELESGVMRVEGIRDTQLLLQRNQRQEWIKQFANWKPQSEGLVARLEETEAKLRARA